VFFYIAEAYTTRERIVVRLGKLKSSTKHGSKWSVDFTASESQCIDLTSLSDTLAVAGLTVAPDRQGGGRPSLLDGPMASAGAPPVVNVPMGSVGAPPLASRAEMKPLRLVSCATQLCAPSEAIMGK
jgi:hypothetical protein